ncbi:MAG: nitrite reductase [Rhodospirillales bacterium]|nr:nitrite reductase [Rhodospirillales bacterium]
MKSLLAGLLALLAQPALADDDAGKLYADHCADCHGFDRLGGVGPALLPENLGRLKPAEAVQVILEGRVATQMLGLGDKLSKGEAETLAKHIYTPLARIPVWGEAEIAASRVTLTPPESLPAKPVHQANPLNLFTVVELGDHHVTILDGDRFLPLNRFQSRFALHGGAKYSPDGRFVYLASRDGWVLKYDLYSLKPVAEVRVGINTRNIAVSSDGRYVAAANYLPHTITLLDASDLSPLKVIEVKDENGTSSRVSAIYTAPPRQAFIAALKDVKEVWEIPYGDTAKVSAGLVHGYEKSKGEARPVQSRFPLRRIVVDGILDDFFFDPAYAHLIGASREGKAQVVDLLAGRTIKSIELSGMPHLGSGIVFQSEGRQLMATPNLKESVVSIVDMKNWEVVKRIATPGPGFFLRGHENSPYAWTDTMMGKIKDTMTIIDTRTLEVVRTITPSPGKTAAHVEFTRDGKYALVSIWEMEGDLVIYDAATFLEVKRLPMKKPSGKYNVWNKINYSSGTSH